MDPGTAKADLRASPAWEVSLPNVRLAGREGLLLRRDLRVQPRRRLAIDTAQRGDLATNALGMAIDSRRPSPGTIIHGDHGTQGGFNRPSQHCLSDRSQGTPRRLRLVSSSRVSCGAGC